MIRTVSRIFSVIELTVISLLILRCGSTINPTGDLPARDVTTLNSFIQDSGFSCLDNPGLSDTQSLNQLCFKLSSEKHDENDAVAPLPILSVFTLLTENTSDTTLINLRSKIPRTFLKVESVIQQNSPWYNGIKMESIFWGQSGYLFSTNFLNTISLCNGARLKAVDFARSGDNFPYTLCGYLHSLPDAFDSLSFSSSDNIDSIRGVFTSAFYVTTLFDPSVIADTNYEGIFQGDLYKMVVTKGIRFKKGLKTYQDSSSVVYNVALNDTSLLMYVFSGTNDFFKLTLQEILKKQISLHSDTINQLWLPFVSIKAKYKDDFYNYFPVPINDTTIDYSYLNNNGALKLSDVTTCVFFSLSTNLTVASNAAVWLKATPKEKNSNWSYEFGSSFEGFLCGNEVISGFDCLPVDTIPDCRPFTIALIHKKTNLVLSVASVTTVPGTPLCNSLRW